MQDHIDALHVLTLTVGCGLFVQATAYADAATMLDALPLLFAIVGVALHRTGRLENSDDVQEATNEDVRDAADGLETAVDKIATDGGSDR